MISVWFLSINIHIISTMNFFKCCKIEILQRSKITVQNNMKFKITNGQPKS